MEIDDLPRATMADIAKMTGLSKATVCRALNRNVGVSPATHQMVERAAIKLGYRADPALRALSQLRWKNRPGATLNKFKVALVDVADRQSSNATNAVSKDGHGVFSSIAGHCKKLDIQLEVFHLHDPREAAEMGRILYHRGVDGIVARVAQPMTDWKFPWEHFAVVTVGYDHPAHRHHSMVSDWAQAVQLAFAKARERGAKRIGLMFFPHHHPVLDCQLRAAMRDALAEAALGGEPGPPLFIYESMPIESNRKAFARWFKQHRPDAVIDGNAVAYWWLESMGARVLRRVFYASLLHPDNMGRFPGVYHRYDIQGQIAAEKVIHLLQLNRRGPQELPLRSVVGCEWRDQDASS